MRICKINLLWMSFLLFLYPPYRTVAESQNQTVLPDAYDIEYQLHDNNRMRFMAFNDGSVGARAGYKRLFQFDGDTSLFEGQLVIGASPGQLSGGLFVREFKVQSRIIPIESSLNGFDQAYQALFTDENANHPIGVSVLQRTHSKSTNPDRDFIVVDYWIKNTSNVAVTGIYAGLTMDWDVGDAQKNLGGYDAVRKLNYMYESGDGANSYYYGVAALQGNVSGSAVWLTGSDDNSDAVVFARMIHFSVEYPDVPYDRRSMLSVGPYTIGTGDSIRCVFAVLGGRSLDELKANADTAAALFAVKTSWAASLSVSGSNGSSMTRAFGGDPKGTDGMDPGLDVLSPPPPQTYYSGFQIDALLNCLSTDIRNWEPPFLDAMDWLFTVQNAEGITTTISWNPSDFPAQGSVTLIGAGTNVNMRTTQSVTFTGNRTLAIQYRTSPITMTYNFTKPGWHMVSLNVVPRDSSVKTLFPCAQGNKAFIWDPLTKSYNIVVKMVPGKGYWISVSNPAACTVTGSILTRYSTYFSGQGWYMIGSAVGEIDFTNPADTPEGTVLSPVFEWNPSSVSYVSSITLEEKQGYWAAVFSASILSVGPSQGMGKPHSQMNWDTFYQNCGNTPPGPPNFDFSTSVTDVSPSEFTLFQNYPNPFNSETRFKYSLPEAVQVKWAVYDVNGRKVFERNEGRKAAGTHSIVWNAGSYSSGMYVFRFQAGKFSRIRKCVLLK